MTEMKGDIDTTPHAVLKHVINIELSVDELNVLLDAIYWQDNEMVPDTDNYIKGGFHELRELPESGLLHSR